MKFLRSLRPGPPTPSTTQASTNVCHIQLRVLIVFQVSPVNMKIRLDKVRDYFNVTTQTNQKPTWNAIASTILCNSTYTLAIHYNVHSNLHKRNFLPTFYIQYPHHLSWYSWSIFITQVKGVIVLINPLINHQ